MPPVTATLKDTVDPTVALTLAGWEVILRAALGVGAGAGAGAGADEPPRLSDRVRLALSYL